MRHRILIILIFSSYIGHSQVQNLFGAYTANWMGPSFRYLFLNCDSTYQFVTDWDFQVNNEFDPPREVKRKWTVDESMNLILEQPPFEFSSFVVQSEGTLLQPRDSKGYERNWSPIGKINKDCDYNWISEISRQGYTIHKIKPGSQILVSETFSDNQLVEKRTNYLLADSEIQELNNKYGNVGSKMKKMMLDNSDPIKQLEVTLDYLYMFSIAEYVEKIDNGKMIITYFDKNGDVIKK